MTDLNELGVGESHAASIASVVGSYDSQHTKYISVTKIQSKAKSEMVIDSRNMFSTLLKEYARKNDGILPLRMIIYRDGLSEGQFGQVISREIAGIKEACNELSEGYEPLVSEIR